MNTWADDGNVEQIFCFFWVIFGINGGNDWPPSRVRDLFNMHWKRRKEKLLLIQKFEIYKNDYDLLYLLFFLGGCWWWFWEKKRRVKNNNEQPSKQATSIYSVETVVHRPSSIEQVLSLVLEMLKQKCKSFVLQDRKSYSLLFLLLLDSRTTPQVVEQLSVCRHVCCTTSYKK